jgi:hypothetical protein
MGFLRSVFSESDGTGSWSRFGAFLSLSAVIGWVSMVVHHTHAIPDVGGLAFFLTATNAPYGVNLISKMNTNNTEEKKP